MLIIFHSFESLFVVLLSSATLEPVEGFSTVAEVVYAANFLFVVRLNAAYDASCAVVSVSVLEYEFYSLQSLLPSLDFPLHFRRVCLLLVVFLLPCFVPHIFLLPQLVHLLLFLTPNLPNHPILLPYLVQSLLFRLRECYAFS